MPSGFVSGILTGFVEMLEFIRGKMRCDDEGRLRHSFGFWNYLAMVAYFMLSWYKCNLGGVCSYSSGVKTFSSESVYFFLCLCFPFKT